MSFIVVSAANETYFNTLKSLILSLEKNTSWDYPIGILDLGLSDNQVTWLSSRGVEIVAPEWDYVFPGRSDEKRWFMAMTARPNLKKYFLDYDYYFWIDADAWVQDGAYFDLILEVAKKYKMAIVPEIDRSYQAFYNGGHTRNWMGNLYLSGWGEKLAYHLVEYPILNSGVWCISNDHPVWGKWRNELGRALQKTDNFAIEQTALNVAVYTNSEIEPHFLPSLANWNCGHAPPMFDPDRNCFVEPLMPHAKIGIVHLCGIHPKGQVFNVTCTDGTMRQMKYLFEAPEETVFE